MSPLTVTRNRPGYQTKAGRPPLMEAEAAFVLYRKMIRTVQLPPTMRAFVKALGGKSTCSASRYIAEFQRRGWLKVKP